MSAAGGKVGGEDRHPVFSDYAHISGNIGSLKFAVGLRCEDPAKVVNQMLPLAQVVHTKKVERHVRKVVEVEDRSCSRPECVARLERLEESKVENEHLRLQLKAVEARCTTAKNKVSLTETANAMVEEKNDEIRAQIDETQMAIQQLEAEVMRGDSQNQVLRNQLSTLHKEIEKLKAQTDEKAQAMQLIKDKANQEVQFSKSSSIVLDVKRMKLMEEVAALDPPFGLNGDDSDDGED